MFKDTKEGQTNFCHACEYQGWHGKEEADKLNLKHTCGVEPKECDCEEMSCKDGCKLNHTHKEFWCEKCHPERYITPQTEHLGKVNEMVEPKEECKHTNDEDCKLGLYNMCVEPKETLGWVDRFDKIFPYHLPTETGQPFEPTSICNMDLRRVLKAFIYETLAQQKETLSKQMADAIEMSKQGWIEQGEAQIKKELEKWVEEYEPKLMQGCVQKGYKNWGKSCMCSRCEYIYNRNKDLKSKLNN